MNSTISIILTIIIFVGILAIIYIIIYNNLQAYKLKINEAESIIDDLLRKKYDLLESMQDIIINEIGLSEKAFSDFTNLKEVNISSFDFERTLTAYFNLVNQIKNDYDKLERNADFTNNYDEIYDIDERLEASKEFYNKYTTILNGVIKKFPSNLIAKIHHIKTKAYFDGKDMFDEEIKDFKL